jgi:hypothetical protein
MTVTVDKARLNEALERLAKLKVWMTRFGWVKGGKSFSVEKGLWNLVNSVTLWWIFGLVL